MEVSENTRQAHSVAQAQCCKVTNFLLSKLIKVNKGALFGVLLFLFFFVDCIWIRDTEPWVTTDSQLDKQMWKWHRIKICSTTNRYKNQKRKIYCDVHLPCHFVVIFQLKPSVGGCLCLPAFICMTLWSPGVGYQSLCKLSINCKCYDFYCRFHRHTFHLDPKWFCSLYQL